MNQNESYSTIKNIKPEKRQQKHYTSVLLGEINLRLGKAKFHPLRILLDSRASFFIVLDKNTQKLCKKNTKTVRWKNQEGEYQANYQSKV